MRTVRGQQQRVDNTPSKRASLGPTSPPSPYYTPFSISSNAPKIAPKDDIPSQSNGTHPLPTHQVLLKSTLRLPVSI